MHRSIGVLLLLVWLQGCGADTRAPHQVHVQFSDTSGLTVTDDSGKSQQLIAESLDVRPVVAPSGKWIAVEDMRMSNLVVVRLFRYHHGTYAEIALPEIRQHWEALARESGIAFEDLLRPRVAIESFDPTEKILLLRFQADTDGDREIDSMLEIALAGKSA